MPCHVIPRPDNEKRRSHRAKSGQIHPGAAPRAEQFIDRTNVPGAELSGPRAGLEQPQPDHPAAHRPVHAIERSDPQRRLPLDVVAGRRVALPGKLREQLLIVGQQLGGAHERPANVLAERPRERGQRVFPDGGAAQRLPARAPPRPVGPVARILQPRLAPVLQCGAQVLPGQAEQGTDARKVRGGGQGPHLGHAGHGAGPGTAPEAQENGFGLIIGRVTEEDGGGCPGTGSLGEGSVAGLAGRAFGAAGTRGIHCDDLGHHDPLQLIAGPAGTLGGIRQDAVVDDNSGGNGTGRPRLKADGAGERQGIGSPGAGDNNGARLKQPGGGLAGR